LTEGFLKRKEALKIPEASARERAIIVYNACAIILFRFKEMILV